MRANSPITNCIAQTLLGLDFTTECTRTSRMKWNVVSRWRPIAANRSMPDVFTKAKRSEVMSRIRGRGNKDTELALAKLLRSHHITGWRRNETVFGKPDFVFPKPKLTVFVDGCFWHGCPKHATQPKNNRAFWQRKFSANKERDRLVNQTLRRDGWRVIRIWECALRKRPLSCVQRILRALRP